MAEPLTDDESERAAIYEFEGGVSRRAAETMARRDPSLRPWRRDMLALQRLLGVSAREVE